MSAVEIIPTVAVEEDFRTRAHEALGDAQLRGNFRKAMDSLMTKRAAAFSDAHEREHLRALGNAVRARALSKLPELLEQLEQNLTRNGVTVHWAETVDEANGIVLSIIRAHEGRQVIKGKSMVSEEMEMNHVLAEQGIECLESDMGEYIVQLDHEKPSHIIMPAIHKNAGQVASLFHDKLGVEYTKDVDQLIQIGRKVLRQKFFEADIGVSGVNFAVAETGTLLLVENEGNGRMSTTVPPVHIAVTGIEKVVENLRDVVPLLSLLTRSALGQPITTYVNMISVDGASWYDDKASCILVGNVGRLFARVEAFEDASPEDGKLELGVVNADGLVDWARTLARTAAGSASSSPFVSTTKARHIKVKLDRKVLYELDGGDRDKVRAFEVKVEPSAITVCLPTGT